MAVYWYLSLAGVVLVLGGLWVWLWRRLKRLERQFKEHRQVLERVGNDLGDFRTLSAQVDEQMGELAIKLEEFKAWLKEREDQASCGEPAYQTAIERIRQGSDVEELVESLGLSREEAALLIRLHRAGPSRRAYWEA